jgi:hypothetical protein
MVVARVYFTPFKVTTYVPLTMDDIEKKATYTIWFLKEHPSRRDGEHPFVSKLRLLLRAHATREDIAPQFVRLKVVFPHETYVADTNGTVIQVGTEQRFRLTEQEMNEITQGLVNFSGVIDIQAGQDAGFSRK